MKKAILLDYFNLLRIPQYVKNGFIFLPLFFSGEITRIDLVLKTLLAFGAFSLIASSTYIFNDLCDMRDDQQHPVKKLRPLARGAVSVEKACLVMAVLLFSGLTISLLWLGYPFLKLTLLYVGLNVLYSLKLKHISILDIMIISVCFVIRLFAGAVISDIPLTVWIIMITFLLALFISFAKRRDDVLIRGNSDTLPVRRSIHGYNLEFINAGMVIVASAMIVSYIMYSVAPVTVSRFGNDKLYLTSVFVIAGVLRYLQITFVEQRTDSPTKILFTDIFLQASITLWLLSFGVILYLRR